MVRIGQEVKTQEIFYFHLARDRGQETAVDSNHLELREDEGWRKGAHVEARNGCVGIWALRWVSLCKAVVHQLSTRCTGWRWVVR